MSLGFFFLFKKTPYKDITKTYTMETLISKKEQKKIDRKNALVPNGVPRYIRCYDNGGASADRYTVVFTGRYTHKTNGAFWYLGMSTDPCHPMGIGSHGDSKRPIDTPTYSHLGKKIKFTDLTPECQKLVLGDYLDLWDLTENGKEL